MTPTSPSEYELLVSLLTKCPQTIEVLPGDGSIWTPAQNPGDIKSHSEPSLAPFLFVEGNLGIPQKVLYKLYLHAVSVFKSARSCVPTRPTIMVQRNHDLDASLIRILADSSSILLLANPSHQTALNARKHLVRMHLIDPHAELCFTSSLLSSQHCAKHAELWYHRRWLLSAAYDANLLAIAGVDSFGPIRFASGEALRQELQLVSRACELYPRNYFAWTHRLICMRSLLSDYLTGIDIVGFIPILRNEIAGIKQWIDHHVSDYSAVHTILGLSQAVFQSGDSFLMGIIIEENLLDHAISLVQGYPSHEALWMYTRIAISISDSQQAQQIQMFIDRFVQPFVQLQCSKTGVEEDLVKVSQYARQLLNKRGISQGQYKQLYIISQ
ncbi:hypothetical protein L210DRAFT_3756546 [Boletus edulis BED1]|uniref:Protein prenyltransferase n=1 Tax=Boletus edulis BED1 TaxID=1328754 RepID=A0AAD4C3X1_BOLED|nr:hypothetical protein L210DRAFT_3756546 [Boletus edulis BED1]